ncbi:MAG: Dipeptide transport system permease protein DppB [Syntrophomonadaceae bacterium]|nr:Dipeptide transport system permease protein DppB [Bacillota bacterium]
MVGFIIQRILHSILLLFLVSVISFIIIQLPPVDFIDLRLEELKQEGNPNAELIMLDLRHRYGLDQPVWMQYFRWIGGFFRGDLGVSFDQNERPVSSIIMDRLPMTLALSLATMLFIYIVAIPIGIYCATHQYSAGDNALTFIGFIGMATPSFLLALIVMFIIVMYTDMPIGGFISPEYMDSPWSFAKFMNFLSHLWIPVVILGLGGTAGLIRIMRSSLLETLGQQYITTARAKGVKEFFVIYKHALRVAINPVVTIIGISIPGIISGEGLVAMIMNLPTIGPVFVRSLQVLDMFLAGSILMITAVFVVLGNLIGDIMLAWVDPRIRFD